MIAVVGVELPIPVAAGDGNVWVSEVGKGAPSAEVAHFDLDKVFIRGDPADAFHDFEDVFMAVVCAS